MAESPYTTPDEEHADRLEEWCCGASGEIARLDGVENCWTHCGRYDGERVRSVLVLEVPFESGLNELDTLDNARQSIADVVELLRCRVAKAKHAAQHTRRASA